MFDHSDKNLEFRCAQFPLSSTLAGSVAGVSFNRKHRHESINVEPFPSRTAGRCAKPRGDLALPSRKVNGTAAAESERRGNARSLIWPRGRSGSMRHAKNHVGGNRGRWFMGRARNNGACRGSSAMVAFCSPGVSAFRNKGTARVKYAPCESTGRRGSEEDFPRAGRFDSRSPIFSAPICARDCECSRVESARRKFPSNNNRCSASNEDLARNTPPQ